MNKIHNNNMKQVKGRRIQKQNIRTQHLPDFYDSRRVDQLIFLRRIFYIIEVLM